MKFAHISPKGFQEYAAQNSGAHLLLSHLVENDKDYREFWQNYDDGKPRIMDNAGFELYKAGLPMYPSDKLLTMAKQINADYIVMSDYPGEPGQKTIDAAKELGPIFKEAGYKTFFVPQSEVGDLNDYIRTFKWALEQDWIDLIGVSILGVPNAYGVEKNNNLQRFLSRWKMMQTLENEGILYSRHAKKLHFLGMVDGPNEIDLVNDYHYYINSWDTSAAVWAGMNGIEFDDSPTGLENGKCEIEVDFTSELVDNQHLVEANVSFINWKEGVDI